MGRGNALRLAFAVVAALLLATAGPAAAQLQTGDLYGSTVDNEGQPLPGVSITLTGTAGAPQVQASDEAGQFRFLNLYPGNYALKAELDGFSTVEYPDIAVRLGGKGTIEITMSTSAVTDTITVTGESPLLDERRVNQGSNVSTVELDKVPTARDPWALLSQAPGVVVDRINVGGNESGQQSSFLGVGSGSRDNTFAVDGVILTDMNAVGASATYFDFGAFEEVQFTVSSADVSVATSGVTINQVTKRGTNIWRGAGRYLRADGEWQSDPSQPNGNRIDSVEEYGIDAGGPLWQDHLWIWGSYGESDIGNLTPSANGLQLDRTQLEDLNTKLNFQTGPRNSGVAHYWKNDKLKFGRGASPTRAPEATTDQTTPQDIFKIEDTWLPGSNLVVTGLYARDDGLFTLSPQGGLEADRFIDEEGVLRGTTADFTQDAVIEQARLDANYFFNAGPSNHELKFGAGFREQENLSGTIWPRGRSVIAGEQWSEDLAEDVEVVFFPRNRNVAVKSNYDSAWIQDTVSLDRWTINAGLRYDKQTLENLPSSDPGNPLAQGLIPALNFQGNDADGFEWETILPRVGVTYALGKDRKTLLRGTFSQYAEQLGQLPLASRVNPVAYSYAYFYFTDANRNLVFDPTEAGSLQFFYGYNIDPDNPGALFTLNANDPNLDPTLTDELTFGIEQGFGTNFAAGLTLTYRNVHDIPETRLFVLDEATGQVRLATRDDWELAGSVCEPGDECAPLPNGQAVSPQPYYDLKPGLSSTGGRFYTNGDREQDYMGATLSFTRRLASRWSARGHFTYSDWDWKIGPEFKRYDDPTNVVSDDLGFPDEDSVFFEQSGGNKGSVFAGSRWSFGINGLYQVAPDQPWGFNLGASVNGREGFISPPFIRNPSGAGIGNVQVTRDIDSFRNDDIILFDARIDKDFQLGDVNLNIGLDGFNLLNEDYTLQRERSLIAGRPNQVTEALSPRVFRLGATLRFR